MENSEKQYYSHYLAIDWSINCTAIAAMRSNSKRVNTRIFRSDLKEIKDYLESKRGSKILTIEETTGAHWLYVELKESVDKILICDPYRSICFVQVLFIKDFTFKATEVAELIQVVKYLCVCITIILD